ncbi:MAG: GrpB family protein [Prevotella sp.]|jgi:GrpB-like predicted nucleotidyltransferase (UPF0157 family)|nr:GrpB family protein [Prevotella sp.]
MDKSLSEMSNEELWQLFPIIISEHKDCWKNYYAEEYINLQDALKGDIIRINHIGSTAIPNLLAKPTIDILLEIKDNTDISNLIDVLGYMRYIYSFQPSKPAPHMMYMKGYTPQGFEERVYHLHVRYSGDWDELYFRDYLLTHPDVAREYGMLKLKLQEIYKHDRDGYTQAKSDFIKEVTNRARKELI